MKLIPRSAPGRTNRRARAFADEIARLHSEGYSLKAVQQALVDAGVGVSLSTVRREVVRAHRQMQVRQPAPLAVSATVQAASATTPHLSPARPHPGRTDPPPHPQGSPRGIAEAFFASQITNSLMSNRS